MRIIFSVSIIILFVFLWSYNVFSQPMPSALTPAVRAGRALERPSILPLPIGSGARALGMGGSFTAVADDATAVSWNPAGLTNLERPEFSIVGSYIITDSDFNDFTTDSSAQGVNFTDEFSFGGDETDRRADLNFISLSYPFIILNKYVVASLSYQQIFDFHSELKFNITEFRNSSLNRIDKVDIESDGGVGAISPAFAVQLTPKISLGLAVNIFTDEFFGKDARKTKFEDNFENNFDTNETSFNKTKNTFENFQAVNLSFGLLWDLWEREDKRITLGIAFDTAYTASVTRKLKRFSIPENEPLVVLQDERRPTDIDFPMSTSVGLAFQLSNALTVAFDVTWTDWSEWELEEEGEEKKRPIGFDVPAREKINDTVAVRAGLEYLIFGEKLIVPIRGGLFYDPRPSLGDPTDVIGFSVGSGITIGDYSFDFAYQFRHLDNVGAEDIGILGGESDTMEHVFFTSLIVKF